MDAKNLEVLLQLKRAMEAKKAEEKPKARLPEQGFSEESLEIFKEMARKKIGPPTPVEPLLAVEPQKPKQSPIAGHPDLPGKREPSKTLVKVACRECGSIVGVEPDRARARWLCHNCRIARRERRAAQIEARRSAQYQSAKGTKIQQLEAKISAMRRQLEQAPLANPGGLALQLKELEKRLQLERVHKISKYSQIRHHLVSGSYGSGKRSR